MSKDDDMIEIEETLGENISKNSQKSIDKKDHLDPEWGVSYKKFVAEKDEPGTASNLAHHLIEGLEKDQRSAAENLIKNTLQPADLLSYILKEAKTNPVAADAIRQEIIKRLRKQGIEE